MKHFLIIYRTQKHMKWRGGWVVGVVVILKQSSQATVKMYEIFLWQGCDGKPLHIF